MFICNVVRGRGSPLPAEDLCRVKPLNEKEKKNMRRKKTCAAEPQKIKISPSRRKVKK